MRGFYLIVSLLSEKMRFCVLNRGKSTKTQKYLAG